MTSNQRIQTYGIHGVRPWDSTDSPRGEAWERQGKGREAPGRAYMQDVMQSEINMCLNCKWPECVNCLATLGARTH